jgi:hypothetical protein
MTQSKTGFALGIVIALGLATTGCAGSDDTELHQARLLRLEDGARSTEGEKASGETGETVNKEAAPTGETASKEGTGEEVPTKPPQEEPAPEPKPTECIISKILREACTSNDELETAARAKYENIKSLTFSNDCDGGSTIVKVYHCSSM